ncbi:MAG: hypothetical protein M3R17_08955, partial [Bacteroidota bacterium]|nr:hypothetical protein [Bacteroidota bacterium]
MKRIFISSVLLLSAVLMINSCKKENTADTETVTATDNSICENEFMRLLPTVNSIAIDESGVHRNGSGNQVTSGCPNVYVPDSMMNYPRHMYIDYGTGCTDPVDGKVRKGQIICEIDRPFDSLGAMITVTFDTFMVGAIKFEGTTTLERMGPSTFRQVVTNGKCTKAGTSPWTILFDATRDITFTSGANVSTDPQIITITGTNQGTDRNGNTWTSNITTPIVRDLGCTWLTKG